VPEPSPRTASFRLSMRHMEPLWHRAPGPSARGAPLCKLRVREARAGDYAWSKFQKFRTPESASLPREEGCSEAYHLYWGSIALATPRVGSVIRKKSGQNPIFTEDHRKHLGIRKNRQIQAHPRGRACG
jgi:hypothetical protein